MTLSSRYYEGSFKEEWHYEKRLSSTVDKYNKYYIMLMKLDLTGM